MWLGGAAERPLTAMERPAVQHAALVTLPPHSSAHPKPASDNAVAFQKAIDAASVSPAASSTGAAVVVPAGTYVLKKEISIKKSNVVLRGAGVSCSE